MFDNPGPKIKSVAKVIAVLTFIMVIIAFFVYLVQGIQLSRYNAGGVAIATAFGVLVWGGVFSYLAGLFLYAIGELVENTTTIKNSLTKQAEPTLTVPGGLPTAVAVDQAPMTDEEARSYVAIATSPLVENRQAAAADPKTPVDLLRQLAADPVTEVRIKTAVNPSTPVDVLHALASDDSAAIRACVAKNTSTAPETLHILSLDSFEMAAERARQNPNFRG